MYSSGEIEKVTHSVWKMLINDTTNFSLQWRQNEHDGVSNHQPHDCLLNRWNKEPVTRKLFSFDGVIMLISCHISISGRVTDFLDHVSLVSPTALLIIREHYMYITLVYIPRVLCKMMFYIYNGNPYSWKDCLNIESKSWAPFQYPIRRLIIRSR